MIDICSVLFQDVFWDIHDMFSHCSRLAVIVCSSIENDNDFTSPFCCRVVCGVWCV